MSENQSIPTAFGEIEEVGKRYVDPDVQAARNGEQVVFEMNLAPSED